MNVLLVMILSLLGGTGSNQALDDCGSFKATYNSQVLGDKVTISVLATGGKSPYYYFFFDSNTNLLTVDVKQSSCVVKKSELPKFVRVLDSGGCSKTIELNETDLR